MSCLLYFTYYLLKGSNSAAQQQEDRWYCTAADQGLVAMDPG